MALLDVLVVADVRSPPDCAWCAAFLDAHFLDVHLRT